MNAYDDAKPFKASELDKLESRYRKEEVSKKWYGPKRDAGTWKYRLLKTVRALQAEVRTATGFLSDQEDLNTSEHDDWVRAAGFTTCDPRSIQPEDLVKKLAALQDEIATLEAQALQQGADFDQAKHAYETEIETLKVSLAACEKGINDVWAASALPDTCPTCDRHRPCRHCPETSSGT